MRGKGKVEEGDERSAPSRICIVVQWREPYRPLDRLCQWEFIQVVVDEYLSIPCIDFFPCPIIMVWSHDICAIFDDWVRVACYHELSCFKDTTLYTLMPIRGMEVNFVESGHDNSTFPHIRCKTVEMLVSPNVRLKSIFVIITLTSRKVYPR